MKATLKKSTTPHHHSDTTFMLSIIAIIASLNKGYATANARSEERRVGKEC